MIEQLGLPLEPLPHHVSPDRRIDITLDRVRECYEAMSDEQRLAVSQARYMHTIEMIFALRGMERGEEQALGRPARGLADVYDRIVTPGDHPIEALLRTFAELYSGRSSA